MSTSSTTWAYRLLFSLKYVSLIDVTRIACTPLTPFGSMDSHIYQFHHLGKIVLSGLRLASSILKTKSRCNFPSDSLLLIARETYWWAVRDSNPRRRSQWIYSPPHLTALVTAQNLKNYDSTKLYLSFLFVCS